MNNAKILALRCRLPGRRRRPCEGIDCGPAIQALPLRMASGGVAFIKGTAASHLAVLEQCSARRQVSTQDTGYLLKGYTSVRPQQHLQCSHAGDPLLRSTAGRRPTNTCLTKKGSFEAVASDEKNSIEEGEGYDVAILSNGPGEVSSWVRPVVTALKRTCEEQGFADRIRISVS